ncbi:MAG: L-ribulose-5-phosphate 4-epimerase [Planctomycetota bacterium]|nr:MAG: L-ribulose-5-phosphate 4-epimerase [Planctomycetota bacterium]
MLEDLKQQVCQANLDLAAYGLVTLTWGNVSGVSSDRTSFVIKPSGVAYASLRPAHMVVVSLATGEVLEGSLKPSSDAPTHRLLYEQFAGAGGVTHTHSPKATAFAQAGREIPCYGTTHADHFYGAVPVTRPLLQHEINEAYELNTGKVIVERFQGLDPAAIPAVLVAGHAPFAWGADPHDSVMNAVALEAVAAMAIDTLLLNPAASAVDQALLDKHYRRKHGAGAYYGQK